MSAEEPDRFPGAPHPRERATLVGHAAIERAFLDAYRSARFHHAWILAGSEGVGKATLAYRIARFLLANGDPAHPSVQAAGDLATPPEHPAARKVAAGAHPNLFVIRRQEDPDTGKVGGEIPVKLIRKAADFFATSAAEPGWRIAIVDSAEDLNANSANALLKLVEEPPRRSLFLIVSHAPGRLLPTIRSRCRLLRATPLGPADLATVLRELAVAPDDLDAAVRFAEGSVRRSLVGLDADLVAVRDAVTALLAAPAIGPMLALAEKLAGVKNTLAFAHFVDTVLAHLGALLKGNVQMRPSQLEPLAELWNKLERSRIDVDAYNIDRRPFVLATIAEAASLSRSFDQRRETFG